MAEIKNIPFYARIAGNYLQPEVIEPPLASSPHNARLAVGHLSRLLELEIYPSQVGWRQQDGRHDRGEPVVIEVYAVTYPAGAGDQPTVTAPEGGYNRGDRVFILDGWQDENLPVALANPDIFPDGHLFLSGSDDQGNNTTVNHEMIFRFGGDKYKIYDVKQWDGAREAFQHDTGGVYEATARLWRDQDQELDAPVTAARTYSW
jgi:hypothetical protein